VEAVEDEPEPKEVAAEATPDPSVYVTYSGCISRPPQKIAYGVVNETYLQNFQDISRDKLMKLWKSAL
jgi:hypothetical protein